MLTLLKNKKLSILKWLFCLFCFFYSFKNFSLYILPNSWNAQIYKLQNKIYTDEKTVFDGYIVKVRALTKVDYEKNDKDYYLLEHDNGTIGVEISRSNDLLKKLLEKQRERTLRDNEFIFVEVYSTYNEGYIKNEQKITDELRSKLRYAWHDSNRIFSPYVTPDNITKTKLLSVVDGSKFKFLDELPSIIALIISLSIVYFSLKNYFTKRNDKKVKKVFEEMK